MTQVSEPLQRSERSLGLERARAPSLKLGLGFSWGVALSEAALVIALALGSGAAWHLFAYGDAGVLANYARVGALVALAYCLPQVLQGRYAVTALAAREIGLVRLFALWNAAFFALAAIAFLAKSSGVYSRGAVLSFYVVGFAGLAALRVGIAILLARGFASARLVSRRVLLVGTSREVADFRTRLRPQAHGCEIVGIEILPDAKPKCAREKGAFSRALARAVEQVRSVRADDVFLLIPWQGVNAINACADAFLLTPAAINLGRAPLLERYRELNLWRIGEASGLTLARPPLSALEQAAKRALDLVCATTGLIVLAPLLALIALLIKLESPGPVLFRQRRAGFNQEIFRIIKFRTMSCIEDGEKLRQARKNDPRITRLGRLLRATNLDELPQLWNVIRGEMSIVGPRPHALIHDHEFEQRVAAYARRHNVKPGITGWAQVQGHRGPTDTDAKIKARVEHDLYYIDNWSLAFDIQIMALTLFTARAFQNAH